MKRFLFFCAIVSALFASAQKTSKPAWPRHVQVSFAETNQRLARELPPVITPDMEWNATAWKNEKVHTQLVLWGNKGVKNLQVTVTDLKDAEGNIIEKENITTGFVQYVMTDEFKGGCGYRKTTDFDSSRVADIINTDVSSIKLEKRSTQPIWISVKVPADASAGEYIGTVSVQADKKYDLAISLKVLDKTLSSPADWTYNLDLWQHPASIARVHKVELWSDAHFDWMRKYYTQLASAGQKVITASIVNEPWGHQTYDDYPGLIKWTKKSDGSWSYDYSLFDKYVSFVMSCGIKNRISCYSMVPWKIAFTYYDESLQRDTVFTGAIGTPEYNEFWTNMLTDFTRHLKEKDWFGITAIAMDERPMESMQAVIRLLRGIDPNWKVTLAGDYHPEIEKDIYDYCVASRWQFPQNVLIRRKAEGKISTWYTCCTEALPNGFTFSPPDEHVWLGWYTAASGMDGYLRWAFNSWTKSPLSDSRFTAWPAGDTYQVYPGPLSSIRFEKLIEGVQDYEKIQQLRKEYKAAGNLTKLNELAAVLEKFSIKALGEKPAAEMVRQAKYILNQ
jgi:hypothetical protein